jgi:hypothetical protein
MLSPLPRRSGWAYHFARSPRRISLPRKGCRVGLRIVLFEACSAFTRVERDHDLALARVRCSVGWLTVIPVFLVSSAGTGSRCNKLDQQVVGDHAMTETQRYELTHEQVLKICEALQFLADDLDHRDGTRAEVSEWARKVASLWRLLDKLGQETPSLRLVPPGSPG